MRKTYRRIVTTMLACSLLAACGGGGGEEEGGDDDGGDRPGTTADAGGAGNQGGGSGISVDDVEEGNSKFRLSGDIEGSVSCSASFRPQKGFGSYSNSANSDSGEELETRSSGLICRGENDTSVSFELEAVQKEQNGTTSEYFELKTGTYDIIGSPSTLETWRQKKRFASVGFDGFDGPIAWDQTSGQVQVDTISMDFENPGVVATVQATFQEDGQTVQLQGVVNDPPSSGSGDGSTDAGPSEDGG